LASCEGHLEVVKTLLAAKAEVNKSSDEGWTPLLGASCEGHLEVVKTLLAAKAEVNKSNTGGQTPLAIALHHPEVAAVLREAGGHE
jgi:ankyrin repeat protein